ncbi:MAG TPA: hypothetical protein VIY54_08095 [Steroidobacteraceae bacterium]
MLPQLRIWLNHFEYHASRRRTIPADLSDELTQQERHLVAHSLASCALAERSAAGHLLSAAYRFSERHAAVEVARITELLIREQQQHTRLLAEFMAAHGIAPRQWAWPARVLRRLRHLRELGAGLELELCLLLTAELIGIVFYRALEQRTGCQRLRWLCRMMVADQLAHVGFASDLLLAMHARRGPLVRAAIDLTHRGCFAGTAVFIWTMHRDVLRHVGGLPGFLLACRTQYGFYLRPPRLPRESPVRRSGDLRQRS